MRPLILAAVLVLSNAARAGGAAEGPPWQRVKHDGVVEVFTRAAPGWPMKEFRAVTRLRAPLAEVLAAMDDVPGYTRWFADCGEARLLERQGTRDRWTYFVARAPFPVSDRDMITHFTSSRDAATGGVTLAMVGDPTRLPPVRGRVRVPRLEGRWTFTPLPGGEVEVVYQLKSDGGGSLPAWLANSRVADGPFATLHGLLREIASGRHHGHLASRE